MNRSLNILIVNNNNDYNNKVSAELIRYYSDINEVFAIKNYNELLQKLENTNIHILILYLDMKYNKKIIQHFKDIKYIKRLHIIGVYKDELELSGCSYINDCDILLKEGKDFKLFCFQLFSSYKSNTKKYETIKLISESEKSKKNAKQLYELQQTLLTSLHDEQSISKYQKLIDRLFKQIVISHKNISYEILNKALIIACMLKEDIKLKTIINVLIAEFNMNDIQLRRYLRLSIKGIFSISENLYFLANIFNPSGNLPSTREFLITLRNYMLDT